MMAVMRTTAFLFSLLLPLSLLAEQTSTIPYVTPYPGSRLAGPPEIVDFDEYELMIGPAGESGPKMAKLSGRVLRAGFRGPDGRSLREIFANYEEALRKGGFSTIFKCTNKECGQGSTKEFGYFNSTSTAEEYYIAAKKNRPEGPVYIALAVKDKDSPTTSMNIVEVKAMQTGMVKISAIEMKNDLAATGHVALYNILFDTAKADLKAESAAAIAEVARLLKDNPSLKIFVVGHTDNAGTYENNVDLSKRRAEAVVRELTAKQGIAVARVRGVGVASVAPVATNRSEEGRKQNRRVELVEQ